MVDLTSATTPVFRRFWSWLAIVGAIVVIVVSGFSVIASQVFWRGKNARGVPTARGGTWTPVQIMAIERRA